MLEKFYLPTANDTHAIGKKLAHRVGNRPALIFLHGDLGSGKTTFAQGFIRSIANEAGPILSPTFSYVHRYHSTRPIYHFDLYRIEDENAVNELGLDECIDDDNAIRLVEWPERLGRRMRHPDIEIILSQDGSGRSASLSFFHLSQSIA